MRRNGREYADSVDAYRVWCDHCGEQIVGCWGEHGSWKHYATNREHCEPPNENCIASPPPPSRRPDAVNQRRADRRRALRRQRKAAA